MTDLSDEILRMLMVEATKDPNCRPIKRGTRGMVHIYPGVGMGATSYCWREVLPEVDERRPGRPKNTWCKDCLREYKRAVARKARP